MITGDSLQLSYLNTNKMKKIIILILLFFPIVIIAGKFEKNRNRTDFTIGLEHRLTPIYLSGFDPFAYDENNYVYYSQDRQLSGTGLNYFLQYSLEKPKLRINFGQTFRYNYIYTDMGFSSGIPNHINKIVRGLITDYHFSIEKYWTIRQQELSVLAGYSFMNRGTNYSFTKVIGFWPDSTEMLYVVDQDFNFTCFNIELGYKYNSMRYSLGCYFSDKHQFLEPSQLAIIYFRFAYVLELSKKKSED